MDQKVSEIKWELKLIVFALIIYQKVLKMNHLVDVLAKLANFIRDRGLNHWYTVALLEGHKSLVTKAQMTGGSAREKCLKEEKEKQSLEGTTQKEFKP